MSNFRPQRFSDFSWGINLRDSADRINDNQFIELVNLSSEWNKLQKIKGYALLKTLASWTNRVQWVKLFSNYLIAVANASLHVYNLTTWVLTTQATAVTSTTDKFQIIVQKLADLAIVLVNTNPATTEDIKAYEFNTWTLAFTNKAFTWLSDKNFKCAAFYEGKLLLWGNPAASSVLYYSKTFSATSLANLYDFSAYNSWSQPVGDGERIVGFASNNTEFFIFKTNSIWKVVSSVDSWSSYAYSLRQETATWVLNPFNIVNVEKDIMYFDWTTIRRISYEQNIQALSDSAIGKEIENGIAALSQSQESNSYMNYSYPYVKLYLRSNTSSENDFAILYNAVDKGFSTQEWIEGNCGTFGTYNSQRVSYTWMRFSSDIYSDNTWESYNDGDINFSALSKKMNMGDTVNYKTFNLAEFAWYTSVDVAPIFHIYVDGDEIDTFQVDTSKWEVLSDTTWSATIGSSTFGWNASSIGTWIVKYEVKIPFYRRGREFQYKVEWGSQWMFELNYFAITAKHIKGYDKIT